MYFATCVTWTRATGALFFILFIVAYFYYDAPTLVVKLRYEEDIYERHPKVERHHYVGGDYFEKIADFLVTSRSPSICRGLLNYRPLPHVVPVFFVKTDFLDVFYTFFQRNNTKNKYILVTHNSDYAVPRNFGGFLSDPFLIRWFGQNTISYHPKLQPIPIGIANARWPHGNKEVLKRVANTRRKPMNDRNIGVYVNWGDHTNKARRTWRAWFCRDAAYFGDFRVLCRSTNSNFEEYLTQVGDVKFVVSPPGNGVDCHRTWEALAMGAIPIVLNSTISELYSNEKILIVNDFKEVTPKILHDFLDAHPEDKPSKKVFGEYWLRVIETERQEAMKKLKQNLSHK